MTTSYHMSQSVRGALRNWSPKQWQEATEWITMKDGTKFANGALLKAEFESFLNRGIEKLPYGDCDNFCIKEGCRGHPAKDLPLVANKVERHAGADALPAGELASVPARIPVGERASD